jgi:hypothetical protein
MEGWMWAVLLKPLGLLALLTLVALIAWPFRKFLPEGKIKRFLFISWKV